MRRCAILCTLVLSLGSWRMAAAQTPAGSPPPTYGQSILSSFDARYFRQQLNVPLIVPSVSLQSVLPPGYTVLPGDTASILIVFGLQQREELPNPVGDLSSGTYGPSSVMIVQAEAINPNGHYEQLLLDNERSTDDGANLISGLWGEGSARKASALTIKFEELTQREGDGDADDRVIRFSGRVKNEAFGLLLGVQVTVPAAITTAVRNSLQIGPDGLLEPIRFINGTARPPVANAAIAQVINDDREVVPSTDILRVEVPDQELQLPEGTLPILGVGPTVTFYRNREGFQLRCSDSICP
jgi:hypothetical protein